MVIIRFSYKTAQQKTSTHSIPAVNHSWCCSSFSLYVLSHQSSELDQDLCALWDSMVRPGSEVKMVHFALL